MRLIMSCTAHGGSEDDKEDSSAPEVVEKKAEVFVPTEVRAVWRVAVLLLYAHSYDALGLARSIKE
jgi:hypothetical protein